MILNPGSLPSGDLERLFITTKSHVIYEYRHRTSKARLLPFNSLSLN